MGLRGRKADPSWGGRAPQIVAEFLAGATLQSLGTAHGVTREYIRQILKKRGISALSTTQPCRWPRCKRRARRAAAVALCALHDGHARLMGEASARLAERNSEIGVEWRRIPGLGNYEVSSDGRIWNVRFSKLLSPSAMPDWYPRVTLGRKSKAVHQLVMLAFAGPCPKGMNINHRDGIKGNNRLENLEYVTPKENFQHSVDIGLRPLVFFSRQRKLSPDDVLTIRSRRAAGIPLSTLAREYGIGYNWASCVARGYKQAKKRSGGVRRVVTAHKFINGVECKPCTKCRHDLPLAAFTRDSQKRDGLRSDCRACGSTRRSNEQRAAA